MHTRIQRWGNSQGLRLAKTVLEDAQLGVGDEVNVAVQDGVIVNVAVQDGVIVVSPMRKTRGRYRIEDLVEQIPANYHASGVDWGEPVGKETW